MAKRKRNLHQIEYIDGNTARVLNPVPQHSWEDEQEISPKRKKKPQTQKQPKRQRGAQANIPMDFTSLIFLVGALLAVFYICLQYLQVRSDITKMSKDIARLESSLSEKEMENNEMLEQINASVDLNYIYKIATKELGMVHATKDQIILYESEKSDYVRQYKDVPEVQENKILSKILPGK